jgi:hypothetical protein
VADQRHGARSRIWTWTTVNTCKLPHCWAGDGAQILHLHHPGLSLDARTTPLSCCFAATRGVLCPIPASRAIRRTKSSIQAGHQWLTPVILATWEAEIRRITVQGQSRQIVCKTPISKITRAKWTGGVAQMVERLCKLKALSSKPIPTKLKKALYKRVMC